MKFRWPLPTMERLIFLCVTAILNRQNAMFADDYNMEDDTIRNYDIVLNPVS